VSIWTNPWLSAGGWEGRKPDVPVGLLGQAVRQDPEPPSEKKNKGGTVISSKTAWKALPN